MVLRTATKDENVPRPRTLLMVAARDRGRATLGSRTRAQRDRGRGRSDVLDNAPSGGWVEIKLTRRPIRGSGVLPAWGGSSATRTKG